MNKVTMFKLYVSDQEEAKRFYVEQLGFALAEDQMLGEYRWLMVRARGNKEVSINLEIAKTEEEKSLGRTPRRGEATLGHQHRRLQAGLCRAEASRR